MNLTERENLIFSLAYEQGHRDGESGRTKIMSMDGEDQACRILQFCCVYFSLDQKIVCSKSRKGPIAHARQMAMSLMVVFTKLSLKQIGKIFGARDHTTVIHSRQAIHHRREVDEEANADFEYLSDVIRRNFVAKEEVSIMPKIPIVPTKGFWTRYYKDYLAQKRTAQHRVLAHLTQMEVGEALKQVVPFHRPPAIYSNTSPMKIANHQ